MFPHNFDSLEKEIIACRKCPRLVSWREEVGVTKRRAFRDEDYWARPVPGFGDPQAHILVVGLAPGAHGSNRTGRMFTGDASGDFLYPALHRAGFASQPCSLSADDGLTLNHILITAVCRCVPPDNKPLPAEIQNCRPYLVKEMDLLPNLQGIVALGRIAYDATIQVLGLSRKDIELPAFGHGAFLAPGDGLPWILASFHPSRQNTQTGRLTASMFDQIWSNARKLIGT